MKTVDKFLLDIFYTNGLDSVNLRDRKILASLVNQLENGNFLTENQGQLLVKILKENKNNFLIEDNSIEQMLAQALWSKPFRIIEKIRKIYLDPKNSTFFKIEFAFHKGIRSTIVECIKNQRIDEVVYEGKTILIPFTELNLYHIIKCLKKYNFNIEKTLLSYFNQINNIIKNSDQYIIDYRQNTWLLENLQKDIGPNSLENQTLIMDRRIKFQFDYFYNLDNSLTSLIASRKKPRIWISSEKYKLTDICQSLLDLHRFPILFVLDKHNHEKTFLNLLEIHQSMEKFNKMLNVYFRLNNNTGKNFNMFVSEHKLNSFLDVNTDSVILDYNHLPKFILKTDWSPKSIVSYTNNLRSNKLSVYADFVDLIIYYNQAQPIISDTDGIM